MNKILVIDGLEYYPAPFVDLAFNKGFKAGYNTMLPEDYDKYKSNMMGSSELLQELKKYPIVENNNV